MLMTISNDALSIKNLSKSSRFALSDDIVRASPTLSTWVAAGIVPRATVEHNVVGPADFASEENYLKNTKARRRAVKWLTLITKWALQEGLSPALTKEIIEEHLEDFRHFICADFRTWDDFVNVFFARHKIKGASPFLQWYLRQRVIGRIILFSSEELSRATHDFSRALKCSEGKIGVVYKGIEQCSGQFVAVKRLKKVTNVSFHEVLYEVAMNSYIKKTIEDCRLDDADLHVPLVSMLGFSPSQRDPLLVFEYMPNGTLSQHLQGYYGRYLHSHPLERLGIAIDVANALKHLHCNSASPIYHGDVKSTNILLDNRFRAKLADFRATKLQRSPDQVDMSDTDVFLMPKVIWQSNCIGRNETPGYKDPVFEQTGQLSDLTDIYSFGGVLLELATHMRAYDPERSVTHLTDLMRMKLRSGNVTAMLNPKSGCSDEATTTMKLMLLVGLDCCSLDIKTRPRIGEVEKSLRHLLKEYESRDMNSYATSKFPTDVLIDGVAENYDQLSEATKSVATR